MNKIVLGTAQFGMRYGINRKRGRIPELEVFEIIKDSIKFGIDTVDTAHAYGVSEKVVGRFLKSYPKELKIISKLPDCKNSEVNKMFESSLANLNLTFLYGYLIHCFESYKKDVKIWNELKKLKREGRVKKIGFSFYFPSELEMVLKDNLGIDMVQVPYSIFDRRFEPYFSRLKKRNIEIYVRSIFLQGLVFKSPSELGNYFEPVKKRLQQLNAISEVSGTPIFALCLIFALKNKFIDKVVVGVDSIEHFNQIILSAGLMSKSEDFTAKLSDLRIEDERIILPFNWNLQKVAA